MTSLDDLKLFCMDRSLANAELRAVASALDLEIVPTRSEGADRDRTFYPQFPSSLRATASSMAKHYEIFYCLENFIRELVRERLEETIGIDWQGPITMGAEPDDDEPFTNVGWIGDNNSVHARVAAIRQGGGLLPLCTTTPSAL